MPDWTWHPLLRPLLEAGGPPARRMALTAAGSIAARPALRSAVRLFGAIDPPGREIRRCARGPVPPAGIRVPIRGLAAAAALGFGVLVVGPLGRSEFLPLSRQLRRLPRPDVVVLVHLHDAGDAAVLRSACGDAVAGVVLSAVESAGIDRRAGLPVVLAGSAAALLEIGDEAGACGFLMPDGDSGLDALRDRFPDALVIATAGRSTEEAVHLLSSGADAVLCERPVVWTAGPGIAQRIADAAAPDRPPRAGTPTADPRAWPPWIWGVMLSAGMILGGLGAALLGVSRVLLPYDEAFVGLTREAVAVLNGRLLDFLRHDRVTLAGTLMSIGIVYLGLSLGGLRLRERWARRALLVSGSIGFASLFLFLGFGYFDPLHGALTAALFPVFVLAVRRPDSEFAYPATTDAGREGPFRRRGLVGQLLLVLLAGGLLAGGTVISLIGIGGVFVPSDLDFLGTDRPALESASDRMLALVAHDRAGFGGALVSDALALLLLALWGYRPGARWLWWTVCLSGLVGMGAAIGVHVAVGYTDAFHLAPVVLATVVLVAILIVSRPYLCQRTDVKLPAGE